MRCSCQLVRPLAPCRRLGWGGSEIRPEATGYGAVFFAEEYLADKGETLEVSRVQAPPTCL